MRAAGGGHGCRSIRRYMSTARGKTRRRRTSQHPCCRGRGVRRQHADRAAHRLDLEHLEVRLPRDLLPTGSLTGCLREIRNHT